MNVEPDTGPLHSPGSDDSDAVAGHSIRIANAADREVVIRLVSAMWRQDTTARYDWLYDANPHGKALTWLAFDTATGDAVACTSVFPRQVWVNGEQRLGSMGGDCYVMPIARRKGLATALHLAMLREMNAHGVAFMFGPPVPNNLAALVKAGSRPVTTYARWARPLTFAAAREALMSNVRHREMTDVPESGGIGPMHRLARLGVHTSGWRLRPIDAFGSEFDVLDRPMDDSSTNVPVRDRAYLTWKYVEAPRKSRQPFGLYFGNSLMGFVVVERDGPRAVITDLCASGDPIVLRAAIQVALDFAISMGSSTATVYCTQDSGLHGALRRLGFVRRESLRFQVSVLPEDPVSGALMRQDSWYFLQGDQDMDTAFTPPPL